jgi:hypothetical protein
MKIDLTERQKYIYRLIENHLDATKSYNHQDKQVLKVVRSEVCHIEFIHF